jgi:hypothetical protein
MLAELPHPVPIYVFTLPIARVKLQMKNPQINKSDKSEIKFLNWIQNLKKLLRIIMESILLVFDFQFYLLRGRS